jgi:hypothetical protein
MLDRLLQAPSKINLNPRKATASKRALTDIDVFPFYNPYYFPLQKLSCAFSLPPADTLYKAQRLLIILKINEKADFDSKSPYLGPPELTKFSNQSGLISFYFFVFLRLSSGGIPTEGISKSVKQIEILYGQDTQL